MADIRCLELPSSPAWTSSTTAEIEAMVRTLELPRGGTHSPDISNMAAKGPASHTRSRKPTKPVVKAQSKKTKLVDVDLTVPSSQNSSPPLPKPRKRRLLSKQQLDDEMHDGGSTETFTTKKRKIATPKTGSKSEEKRLRLFRKHPPQSYRMKLDRAVSQRYLRPSPSYSPPATKY